MKRLLFLLFALCGVAGAQAPVAWTMDANAGWRVAFGDDPQWAQPGFDDSSWKQIDLNDQRSAQSPARVGKERWYRLHLRPPFPGPVDLLLLDGQRGPTELYVNGQRVGGELQSNWHWIVAPSMVYPLRGQGNGEIVLALRSHGYVAEMTSGPDLGTAMIGSPSGIDARARLAQGEAVEKHVVSVIVFGFSVIFGVLLLAVYAQQRSHREYLWLGLSMIFIGLSTGILYAEIAGVITHSVNAFFADPAVYFYIAVQIEFVYAFIGDRPPRIVRLYQALLVLTPLVMNPFVWQGLGPLNLLDTVEAAATAPGIVLIGIVLISRYRKGNHEAGVLILPLVLANVAMLVFDAEDAVVNFRPDFQWMPAVTWHAVNIKFWDITQALFMLAIAIVLFFRFKHLSEEQAHQEAELESARAVQHVMVPAELPATPSLRIETAYKPAQQVGGDFFQIVPLPAAAGTLVIIGDVSGKGLPAALNVAMIVGAVRSLSETTVSPAEVLAGVNRALCGRVEGGFATCLAMRVQADGQTTMANAGHIAPFCLKAEMDVPNGLPLGITPEAEYEEVSLRLIPGQTLTLMTDGVVEAQRPDTQELFGFDRTAAISGQTAEQIAEAARSFGQSDDIAVLTLQYLPV